MGGGRAASWARWAPLVVATGLALCTVRGLWGPHLPPGLDVAGHLDRVRFGVDLLARGRLDGWYPGSALGYQAFLLNGPGLAAAVGALRLATGGLLSDVGALKVLVVAAFAALPPAVAWWGRSMGLTRTAAWTAGVLSLAVSSGTGGGIQGALATGLLPHHLALPLVAVAMGLLVRSATDRAWATTALLAVVLVALAVTHPISLVPAALLVPAVVVVAAAHGRLAGADPRRWLAAGALALGLGAWWWLPAVAHRDLQGPYTSMPVLPATDALQQLVLGRRGLASPVGVAAGLAALAVALAGATERARRWALVSVAAAPVAVLVVAHALQALLGPSTFVGLQVATRGVAAYACFLLFPVGVLLDLVFAQLPAQWRPWSWAPAALLAAVALAGLAPVASRAPEPAADLVAVAEHLRDEGPAWGRVAFHQDDGTERRLGIDAAGRWLSWASGRPGLIPFGPEYSPGAGPAFVTYDRLSDREVVDWVERARSLGATHVVASQPAALRALAATDRVVEVHRSGPLAAFAITPTPDRPVGSILDVAGAEVLAVEAEHHQVGYELAEPGRHPLALGWSPKWSATVDDAPAALSPTPEGTLAVDLPAGRHTLVVSFADDGWDRLGRLASAGTVVVAAVGAVALRRGRRPRPRPG